MTPEKIFNLYSEHRLKDCTLDFLENIKIAKYHLDNTERFDIIRYVNQTPGVVKKIFESYYEVGFCETVSLSTQNTNEKFRVFEQINEDRKSIRSYGIKPFSKETLSDFLHLFYRITGKEEVILGGEKVFKKTRNIASGGGLYSSEIYIVNNRIEEFPQGVYRYNVYNFELELIKSFETEENRKVFNEIIMNNQGFKGIIDFDNATAFVLFTSILNKHSFKYQDFGIALSFMEIGELIHSAHLAAATLDIGCCAFGSFLNNKLHKFLELKNTLHLPLICMALGNND